MTTAPAAPLVLHRMALSGHCHRVELLLSLLGLPYRCVDIDLLKGEQRRPAFLALNPLGQVPVLEDGELVLADSNAILVYLVERYAPDSGWLVRDPVGAWRQQRWFSLAASHLDHGPATARFSALVGRAITAESQRLGHELFALIEAQLERTPFLVGERPTLADLAHCGYSSQAPVGGIALDAYPRLAAWLARIEALPGFVPIETRAPVAA